MMVAARSRTRSQLSDLIIVFYHKTKLDKLWEYLI